MPQYKTRNVRYSNKTFTKALPLQLWYWASRLDAISPQDRPTIGTTCALLIEGCCPSSRSNIAA